MSIEIIKRNGDNSLIAIVVKKTCYTDIDNTLYWETMALKSKGLKIIAVEDLEKKLKDLKK